MPNSLARDAKLAQTLWETTEVQIKEALQKRGLGKTAASEPEANN